MQPVPDAVPKAGAAREQQVQQLFSEIAPRYDLLNHVLSLNIDRSWRRKAVDLLRWEDARDGTFLDACAGTFDLSLEIARRAGFAGRVVASDFAHPMLVQGTPKIAKSPILSVCGDSLELPFSDGTFDGVTVGFGVRNLADLRGGLGEFRRVLKPGRRLVVLEFTVPPNPIMRAGYLFYFHNVLPLVGRLVSGHPWAYTYLPESVKGFPGPGELGALFNTVGFTDTGWKLVSGGIAAIHWGSA
ncbi:MAG: ubiquinone/menaquinone biosynthesis methyltransferase [Gemmatimonadetes bacterium]|nr:ubiquinone/menaquinone biosynthesis methyltransferase [Gemmatimonadota bacterium]MDA1104189.1 ubiquinone/menaquinone biosynthesis methyltransferase [Gemmatimonadota bacterium]